MGRTTDAFTWPSPLQHFLKCLLICHYESNHCYSCWMCSAWDGSWDDPRPNILQLNTEGLTENTISVIEQLAYKNKAYIIILQETHCTTADKLVIPNFSLAGSILSRNHGLATFVHKRLEWSPISLQNNQRLSGCA